MRVDGRVWVAGTAPIPPGGGAPPPGAYDQARLCLEIIGRALAEVGASLDDVVRTRMYVTDASIMEDVGRAHLEAFERARPASTAVVVRLLDPSWLVEIEVEAVRAEG